MSDSVKFSVCKRQIPNKRDEAPLYYAVSQSDGGADIEWMAKRISQLCTVTRPDVLGVLAALQIVFIEAVQMGRLVRLGDIGDFRVTLRSKGVEKKERYSVSNILKAKLQYAPGRAISDALLTLNYEEVEPKYLAASSGSTEPSNPDGESDNTGQGGGDNQGTEEGNNPL